MQVPQLSRRRFLGGSAAWLGAASLGYGQEQGLTKTVSIFHTTDLHGHILPTVTYDGVQDVGGFARCASQIRAWRKEVPDSILVDIGDVYQGTAASFLSSGKLMMNLFNQFAYDAWTLGNHDFDWGRENLETNLGLSKSPILTGNLKIGGGVEGKFDGPWKNVRSWTMKEVGGFRIALIGLITPGLPFWLSPETLGGVEATDPIPPLKKAINEAKAEKADAIVVMGHMGFRAEDDFANRIQGLLGEVQGVDIYLGGHTHQNKPMWTVGGTICSQASYHGIHCGRVDLTFDRQSRKLVDGQVRTVLMDNKIELDPIVLEIANPDLKKSDEQLGKKIGVLARPLSGRGRNSEVVQLLCETFRDALAKNGTPVDGVFHGSFNTGNLPPGDLTVGTCWKILPYENLLVTAELGIPELVEIVQEDGADGRSDRTLWPFEFVFNQDGQIEKCLFKGEPVAADRRFKIVFNSYDAQSAGQRLSRLNEILSHPASRRVTTSIDARSALIDGILGRKVIQ